MQTSIQKTAAVGAFRLLLLQIIGGLEYVSEGSLYTKASMVGVMMTLAVLPMFIAEARQAAAWLVCLVLSAAFIALMAYSLPATIGRTGEVREGKVLVASKEAADLERIRADHAMTLSLVAEANKWQASACKGGVGKDCKAATFVLNQRQASLEKLASQLEAAKPANAGDSGSAALAWALSGANVGEAAIRRSSVIGLGVGLELAIWALVAFATSVKVHHRVHGRHQPHYPRLPAIDPVLTREEQVQAWIAAYVDNNRRVPSFTEVREAFDLPKATASRYRQKALEAA